MVRWAMVIDISKCIGCYCCFAACKDEYWGNDYLPYSLSQPKLNQFWMSITSQERGKYPYIKVAYMPHPCMQCQNAPCLKAAKDGAIYRNADGVVIIDPVKAKGQKRLVETCPYRAIFWNAADKVPQKCTFCAHRLEAGKLPRCVQACPSGCLSFGDQDDPGSEVARLLASAKGEVYRGELKTQPRVYYLDLYKITRHFIAGEAIHEDTDDCAEGVAVTLSTDSTKRTTTTNAFGNFEFDGLEPGQYRIKLESRGYKPKSIKVDLKNSQYMGNIILNQA